MLRHAHLGHWQLAQLERNNVCAVTPLQSER